MDNAVKLLFYPWRQRFAALSRTYVLLGDLHPSCKQVMAQNLFDECAACVSEITTWSTEIMIERAKQDDEAEYQHCCAFAQKWGTEKSYPFNHLDAKQQSERRQDKMALEAAIHCLASASSRYEDMILAERKACIRAVSVVMARLRSEYGIIQARKKWKRTRYIYRVHFLFIYLYYEYWFWK